MNFLGVLLIITMSCAPVSNDFSDDDYIKEESNFARTKIEYRTDGLSDDCCDSLLNKTYFNEVFLDELNRKFNIDEMSFSKRVLITNNVFLEEYLDQEYYYLVLNINNEHKVLHGSELIHCKALFGELSGVLSQSFIWTYNDGCGSGVKKTWMEYNFEGDFLNSADGFLWADEESSVVLFKTSGNLKDVFALNTDSDSLWKAIELTNEETFYESYNWEFSKIEDNTIQAVYHSSLNDTIWIPISN